MTPQEEKAKWRKAPEAELVRAWKKLMLRAQELEDTPKHEFQPELGPCYASISMIQNIMALRDIDIPR